MSDVNDVDILGMIRNDLGRDHITPSERNVDPNRLNWPYLRVKELKTDTNYLMRIMPSDDQKNPNGYVKKSMYQIPLELDLKNDKFPKHTNTYVMMPSCLDPTLEDPIKELITGKIRPLMKGPSSYDFVYEEVEENGRKFKKVVDKVRKLDEDGNELPLTPHDEFRDEIESNKELRLFLEALSSPWTQYIMPVLICATCKSTKNANNNYNSYSDYEPDDTEENWLPRLFQISDVKAFREKVIPNLKPRGSDEEHTKKANYKQWNDRYDGVNFSFSRAGKPPFTYSFDKEGTGSLPEDIDSKLEIGDNYIDLVSRELVSCLKTPDEMMKLLRNSKYSAYLQKYGLLD